MRSVAIIGAGPAGLVAARFLKAEDFKITLFDQCARMGGQWTSDPEYSGIWPNMRTNTSRPMTCFSDLRQEQNRAAFTSAETVCSYLERYADLFDLNADAHLGHRVTSLSRDNDGNGFRVTYVAPDGTCTQKSFSHAIVASGRHRDPAIPDLQGLQSFTGSGGVSHSFSYRSAERFRGQRVVVLGGSISALEIASELAQAESAHVISACRRQRYVLSKVIAGIPTDQCVFTRYAALCAEHFSVRTICEDLKELITRTTGAPQHWGTLVPANNVLEAGITLSQNYLPLVADGRIATKPGIQSIEGQNVRFEDDSKEVADAIVLGTGYRLSVDFLSHELQQTLKLPGRGLSLYKHTFHPNVPNLAFLGLYDLLGPYFPVAELQARWIAYTWSGAAGAIGREHMMRHLSICSPMTMQSAALTFARESRVEPDLDEFPALRKILLFGPLSAVSFRLSGRDRLPNAADLLKEDALAYGMERFSNLATPNASRLEALNNAAQAKLGSHAEATGVSARVL